MDTHGFIDLFLKEDALCHIVAYMCNNTQGLVTDPITNVLYSMITSPIQIVLTQVGVAPFKDKNTLVFPYRLMNEDQKSFIRSFVQDMEYEITGTIASVQIGGGCMLNKSTNGQDIFLDYVHVLTAFCNNVSKSKTHQNPAIQRAICNIIIQRIGSLIHLVSSQTPMLVVTILATTG